MAYSIMHIRYALGVEEYYGGERRGVNKRYVNKKGGDRSKGPLYIKSERKRGLCG